MGMTTLLERAIAEIEKLSPDIQDAIAARLLAELADETQWQTQFAATTDEQWQKMVVAVQAEIAEENSGTISERVRETGGGGGGTRTLVQSDLPQASTSVAIVLSLAVGYARWQAYPTASSPCAFAPAAVNGSASAIRHNTRPHSASAGRRRQDGCL
jgi:hypothetical protein